MESPPSSLQIIDRETVLQAIDALRPDVVVNLAALVDVDACEVDPEGVLRTNTLAVRFLAEACRRSQTASVSSRRTMSSMVRSSCLTTSGMSRRRCLCTADRSWRGSTRRERRLSCTEFVALRQIRHQFCDVCLGAGGQRPARSTATSTTRSARRPSSAAWPRSSSPCSRRAVLACTTSPTRVPACARYDIACHVLQCAGLDRSRVRPPSRRQPSPVPRTGSSAPVLVCARQCRAPPRRIRCARGLARRGRPPRRPLAGGTRLRGVNPRRDEIGTRSPGR